MQVYADGFEALPLRRRSWPGTCTRPRSPGRDIYYDQRYRHNLDMRATLEALVRTPRRCPGRAARRSSRYTKLFWINTGPHNSLTARKFVLELSRRGARRRRRTPPPRPARRFPLRAGETLDGLVDRLAPVLFDADVDPMVTNKNPPAGQDILAASANNLYAGVTIADLDGFDERYELNSRLVKRTAGLVEEVYRIGGRYGAAIRRIVGHLEDALP